VTLYQILARAYCLKSTTDEAACGVTTRIAAAIGELTGGVVIHIGSRQAKPSLAL